MTATRTGARVGDALAGASDGIAAAGSGTPRLDAELLLAEAAGLDRAELVAKPERELTGPASRAFATMVRRRLRREPVAYILGRKGFRGIELEVDQRVLIPRPETELLVVVALELRPGRAVDVGTGSGAVALALADELPGVRVAATDTSTDALAVAGANARRLGLAEAVSFSAGMLPPERGGIELLLANLPYVSAAEWSDLQPEITEFEPREALVPGPTGLEAIEGLLAGLTALPDPPASVALEVGAGQAAAVAAAMRSAGYAETQARPDLAGIERVVLGRR
ncbi:MAG: peptide chain release factor N(5)-glutamine methyltransferase [Solirubrobacterales bacterium]|nr:peptide chain release factor N(5)-glutamine methyltransferase [Solirubrobacterales bacterium]